MRFICPRCKAALPRGDWDAVRHIWLCGVPMRDALMVYASIIAEHLRRGRSKAAVIAFAFLGALANLELEALA
jgi:hypothetical protein